jgi:hypothetical protein
MPGTCLGGDAFGGWFGWLDKISALGERQLRIPDSFSVGVRRTADRCETDQGWGRS